MQLRVAHLKHIVHAINKQTQLHDDAVDAADAAEADTHPCPLEVPKAFFETATDFSYLVILNSVSPNTSSLHCGPRLTHVNYIHVSGCS